MFKSSIEKNYNLKLVIKRLKKTLMKNNNKLSELHLDGLVNTVALYHKTQFENVPYRLYKNDNKDLVDLAKEDEKVLTELFNLNNLYQLFKLNPDYAKEKFKTDDNFRRKVMYIALYEIID